MANTVEKGLVSKSALTAIGDAIRAKNGSTTKYKPSEMAAAISNLKGGDLTVATSDRFNFRVVQSANQTIHSTPIGKTVSNSDGTVSLALTDATTISPNTNYVPGTIQRSYDDSTHTYTVTATDAEPIDGLVQNGWSVVYQKNPSDSDFYTNADYTGTAVTQYELQGNILVGGMQSYSNSSTLTYPNNTNKILKFKNTFITSTSGRFLADCTSLNYVELPNLTEVGEYFLSRSAMVSIELPNITKAGLGLLSESINIRSVELPKLTNLLGINFLSSSKSSPVYFVDCGYATDIDHSIFRYSRVIILRANTVPVNFEQTQLSFPVLYIVPSALVDTYKSKVRQGAAAYDGDVVTALEDSPFADGKTVCGNNMKTVYVYGVDGETPNLGEGTMLWFDGVSWQYVPYFGGNPVSETARLPENTMYSGFYFLSKLTKEQGYTIPPQSLTPSGSISVGEGDMFTVPSFVKVIRVYYNKDEHDDKSNSVYTYVGVTPGKTYELECNSFIIWPNGNPDNARYDGVYLGSITNYKHTAWFERSPSEDSESEPPLRGFELSWSPEINKMTPTYIDY